MAAETSCRFFATDDRVIVEVDPTKSKSPGGILIPDNAKAKPRTGTIIAVGPGRILDNGNRSVMALKLDDQVVFSDYAGMEIDIEGEPGATYKVMGASEVLAVRATKKA